ncbi:MAG: DNA repair protein RecN [Anaerovibrio sp.]|uniref:DNA repair protein RecN n=1 Tax=Anaerovibrio sp. TaxID=1872532 RepID=UPI0026308FFE|nr:DNA repair protein RecN [Anaerovibrio sp.]MDD7677615.1 DNA repair protein RecN [Anaerovibrio sp.]MDY2603391.1 DNA repair protein RecN [Anaerovibrio sp.]MDY4883698.1 DNA repair protein RecN [Anaerovibrio sp.]
MLNTLTVWNFALLEHIQIEFDKGLNILTGETGAGKSILIDALGAMLGSRLSTELIRHGRDWLRVEAVFSLEDQPGVVAFLEENAIDTAENELIITRQITSSGRGSILINGCHTTLAVLKNLGGLLVDVHGQNENLSLLKLENQFQLVDGSSEKLGRELAEYRDLYKALKEAEARLSEKENASRDYEQRLDMLRWQIQEIEAAQLQENEDEELQRQINKLSNAEKISRYASEACGLLYGGGSNGIGVVSGLEEAVDSLKALSRFDDALEDAIRVLGEAAIQVKEAGYEVRDYAESMEFDPRLLDRLQSRMDVIDKLRRKYGATIEDILAYYDKCQQELADIENYDEDIARLQEAVAKAREAASQAAGRVTELRRAAAGDLSDAIEGHLTALGMPDARFVISVQPSESLGASGGDRLEILFSANPGQEPKPIQKVASGGELSRIALAIKTVTASRDASPASMVFDEIDTGIGGKTAQMVAERIAMAAASKQVLCITHLPQIACMADNHLYISKHVADNQTSTEVRSLSEGERINEIARMASGANVSSASLDNAREMIAYAKIKKEGYRKNG